MNPQDHHVAVLGASPKPARYANQAIKLLQEKHYKVTPIHPVFKEIESLVVVNSLSNITDPVDTLTLYVGPERLQSMIEDVISLKPGRVIFNPGTESRALQLALSEADIRWEEACTLVLLRTEQFNS